MEHWCTNDDCGKLVFNNEKGPDSCPDCGAYMMHSYDEIPEYDYEDYMRERDEREEEEDYGSDEETWPGGEGEGEF